jgi:hypothetical protein
MCNCSNKLTTAQAKEVWAKHVAGFRPNLIAAQLMIRLSCVEDVISKGDPMQHPILVQMAEELKPKKAAKKEETTEVEAPKTEI